MSDSLRGLPPYWGCSSRGLGAYTIGELPCAISLLVYSRCLDCWSWTIYLRQCCR